MTRTLTLVAALLFGLPLHAHQITAGDLEIIHPAIPAPFAGAKSAAGYMAIVNNGTEADRLIGAEAAFADRTMLHRTETSADGVATMTHVEVLEIPPGETVVLESGGYHVMFMGLKQTLTEGDLLPATLTFEKAGTVAVEFMVDPPGAARHDHSQHGAAKGHGAHGPMSLAGLSDPEAITALLMAQFDTPEAPLTVAPITVQGDVAVAGWSQDGRGGRAFLRRDAEGWFVELCAGRELSSPAMLQDLGLTAAEAETLASASGVAEAAAGPDLAARLDSFQGMILIGRDADHAHAQGHGG
jgi:copper(I)-binding protein